MIYIIAMSDIIFRNQFGEYKTFIDEDYIANALEIKNVRLVDCSIETKNITNFNNKWRCSTPNINGIKAGSVFKYKFDGNLDNKLLLDFMNKGIGERRLDGFGRFIVVKDIKDSSFIIKNEIETDKDFKSASSNLNKDEKRQLESIVNEIYKNRLDSNISKFVIEIDNKIKNAHLMTNSQWGKYKDLFMSFIYEESVIGKEKYYKYIEHIKQKRSKSFYEIDKLKYEDRKFLEFLKEFIEKSTEISMREEIVKVQEVELGEIKSNIGSEYLYKHNMKILVELCKYQIRKERK